MIKYKNIIILFILFFTAFSAFSRELISEEIRSNNGRVDRWIYLKSDGGLIVEADNNFDGVIDYFLETDASGNKIFESIDSNFNGVMDTFFYYENGVLVRKEIDSNSDGQIDMWIYIEEGVYVVRIERSTNNDGVIDFVRRYR
ncbi:MAG: hypothetical protein FWD87_07110 [Spirochaetaceae bacterium]|nr:hypothetical protein [Spirochaetaceae bacterium]